MRTLVSLLTVAVVAPTLANTDFERLDKKVARYAAAMGGDSKALCLCRDSSLERAMGYLLRGSSPPVEKTSFVTSQLSCFVPGFDETSGAQGTTYVCLDFVPIAK